jgi:hypothetical protein
MDFSWFGDSSLAGKDDHKTKSELLEWVGENKTEMQKVLKSAKPVDWPGEKRSPEGHIYSLIAHERLHHGQLISYFTLAGIDLPPRFRQNWAL